jgi:hypothetical protein
MPESGVVPVSVTTKLVLGGIFAVVLSITVIGAVLAVLAGDDSGSIEINLGDDTFAEIDAELGADLVDEQGPLIFPDPAGGTRPLLLQHLGDDPDRDWFAMLAIAPDSESCIVEWQTEDEEFRDCEGTTYPADGTGLTRYVTTVEEGKVTVDLRIELDDEAEPIRPTTTLTAPATTD